MSSTNSLAGSRRREHGRSPRIARSGLIAGARQRWRLLGGARPHNQPGRSSGTTSVDILRRVPRRATTDGSGGEPSATLRSQHVRGHPPRRARRRSRLVRQPGLRADVGRRDRGRAPGSPRVRCITTSPARRRCSAPCTRRWRPRRRRGRSRAGDPERSPIDQIVAMVNAYLDVALDEEIQRITLIDGPALLGLEPDGPADQQATHAGCGRSSPRRSGAARSSTSTPTSSRTSSAVWRCWAVC